MVLFYHKKANLSCVCIILIIGFILRDCYNIAIKKVYLQSKRRLIYVKINSFSAAEEFRDIISRSDGQIWMQDSNGQEYDLKSELNMCYIVGRLLSNACHDLELYASDLNSQMRLVAFFRRQMHQRA